MKILFRITLNNNFSQMEITLRISNAFASLILILIQRKINERSEDSKV